MATSIDLDRPLRRRAALRALAAIVGVNAAMFVVLRLTAVFSPAAADTIVSSLSLPSSPGALMLQPWTLVTYFFTHYDPFHIILNMLWLCWFGLIMADAGSSARHIAAAFFAGGIAAGLAYMALAPDGASSGLLGSSGAVMAVVAAAAVSAPKAKIDLPLIRPVSVAAAAAVIIAVDLSCLALSPTGSHAAHLGGIMAGAVAAAALRRSRRGRHSASRAHHRDAATPDRLMEKLRTSGYDSLTPLERQALISRSK